MVGGRFIEFRVIRGKNVYRFRDSMNLSPTSVASIGEALGFPKGITPDKFKNADRARGWDATDTEYCALDCKIIFKFLEALHAEFGELRATVPSLALTVFRRHYQGATIPVVEALDFRGRESYYGARVEAYLIGLIEAAFNFDINSLYPFSMISTVFPDPSGLYYLDHPSPAETRDREGFLFGTATVPLDLDPPPLPYRWGGKLLFPVGTFEGAWALPEIRSAQALGVSFDAKWGVLAPSMPSPFVAYVADMYERKRKALGIYREIYKLMLNALYGKYGEFHSSKEEYAPFFDQERFNALAKDHPDVAWRPISLRRSDGYYTWAAESGGIARNAIYLWASYVTARSRVINLQTQNRIRALGGRTFYTDTDSFLVDLDLSGTDMVGDDLGLLKLETKKISGVWGPKNYEGNDIEKLPKGFVGPPNIKLFRTLKGVRRGAVVAACNLKTQRPTAYGFWTVRSPRSAIRLGVGAGEPYYLVRSADTEYTKRKVLASGETRPLIMGTEKTE